MYLGVCYHMSPLRSEIDKSSTTDVLGFNDSNSQESHSTGSRTRTHIHSRTPTMAQRPRRGVRFLYWSFRSWCSNFRPFVSEWHLSPKQDHLVCFLAGSLMLGAATTGMRGAHVSRPPVSAELTVAARVEWTVGEELLRTCVETHNTATYVFFIIISDHLNV